MTPLTGLGIWIWERRRCEGGDLEKIIARAKACGVSWVAIKAGGSLPNGQVTRAVVEEIRAAGIDVAAWWYSVPGAWDEEQQLALLKDLVNVQGVTQLICDAESEWEGTKDPTSGKLVPHDWRGRAGPFAAKIRETIGPDAFLADAPWPIVRAHAGFPWREFGSVVDARMDQLYWMLAHDAFSVFAQRADANWATMPPSPPRCPIGCTVDYSGLHHAPLDELRAFLERYGSRPARSLWSWQHLSENEWALLEELAAPPPIESAPGAGIESGKAAA